MRRKYLVRLWPGTVYWFMGCLPNACARPARLDKRTLERVSRSSHMVLDHVPAGQKFRRVGERTLTAVSEPLVHFVILGRFHRPM